MAEGNVYKIHEYGELERSGFYYQLTYDRNSGYRRLSGVRHSHEFLEIIYLMSGGCAHCVNETQIQMRQGDAVVLRVGDEHVFASQQPETLVFALSVTREAAEPIMNFIRMQPDRQGDTPPVLSFSASEQRQIDALVQALFSGGADRETLLRRLLTRFVWEAAGHRDDRDDFLQAIERIHEGNNLQRGMSALLELTHYSHGHLCRKMRESLGTTPGAYLKEQRLRAAREYVIHTNLTAEEIAYRVGYDSLSHFIQTFKNRFGNTPSAMRRAGRK